MEPVAFGDSSWILGRARVQQKLKPNNSERIRLGYRCRIDPWSDYVAVSFIINSTFCVLGKEIESKSGPP
jgi:hypothetical protein